MDIASDDHVAVSIRAMEFMLSIGVTEAERARLQPVKIDLTAWLALDHDFSNSPVEDLAESIDYAMLLQDIQETVMRNGSYLLLETLGEKILQRCLQHGRVEKAEVTLMKKDFASQHALAEIKMTRHRR